MILSYQSSSHMGGPYTALVNEQLSSYTYVSINHLKYLKLETISNHNINNSTHYNVQTVLPYFSGHVVYAEIWSESISRLIGALLLRYLHTIVLLTLSYHSILPIRHHLYTLSVILFYRLSYLGRSLYLILCYLLSHLTIKILKYK